MSSAGYNVLGAILGFTGFIPGWAQTAPSTLTPEQMGILHRVDAYYNHSSSLQARYVESYKGMGMTRSESGTLLLKKPGRMAWHYDMPAGKVFIFDGRFAWFYTPGDAQAEKIPGKQIDDVRTPLRFLLGHTKLEKELDRISVSSVGNQTHIDGVPKGMAARIRLLSLTVTPAGLITEMKLEELDGARTEFTFSDQKENIPIPDSEFHFSPPVGVTVVSGSNPI